LSLGDPGLSEWFSARASDNVTVHLQEAFMTVTAYSETLRSTPVPLQNNIPALVLQLRLPHTGKFVVWGKVTITNDSTAAAAGGSVLMTTLDGANTLDRVILGLGGSMSIGVSLQSTLDLSQASANEIVDLRCALPGTGHALDASLIAIPVDALSGSVLPPA
jgi:hypothetical protein